LSPGPLWAPGRVALGLVPASASADTRAYLASDRTEAAPQGVELEITIEIQAVNKDGYPDTTTRIVSENARSLKFDQSSFEDR
jgi:hypothetical protein